MEGGGRNKTEHRGFARGFHFAVELRSSRKMPGMVIKRAHHLIWLGHNTGQEIISEQMPVSSDRRAGDGVRHRGFLFYLFIYF